jgi:dipeptide/tripeptide permease
MALFISVGNMGSIMGSNIYLAQQQPTYPLGFGLSMAMLCLAICMAIFLRFAYAAENKKRDALLAELGEEGVRAMYTEDQLVEMGDKSPFFRYSL